jgi:hypothetical protein
VHEATLSLRNIEDAARARQLGFFVLRFSYWSTSTRYQYCFDMFQDGRSLTTNLPWVFVINLFRKYQFDALADFYGHRNIP